MSKGYCAKCGDTEFIEGGGMKDGKIVVGKFCKKCGNSLTCNIKTGKSEWNIKDLES